MPPPHPTSITLRPSSGLDEFGSLLKCLQRVERIKDSRVGFITCKGLNGPLESHHVSAMEANLATSAGFSDEEVVPPPLDLDGPRGGDGGGGGGGGGAEDETTEAYLLH